MSKLQLHEITFINELGEAINPGDKVIIVTKKWQKIHVCRGSFLGVYKSMSYSWRNKKEVEEIRCVVMCDEFNWTYRRKAGERINEEYTWSYELGGSSLDHWELVKKVPKPRRTCLQLNRIYKSAEALVESLS